MNSKAMQRTSAQKLWLPPSIERGTYVLSNRHNALKSNRETNTWCTFAGVQGYMSINGHF